MTEEQRQEVYEDEMMVAEAPEADEAAEESANPNETKAEKFNRLATKRINDILKGFNSLGKLSSSAYEYTDAQVEKMQAALQSALDETCEKFKKADKGASSFSF